MLKGRIGLSLSAASDRAGAAAPGAAQTARPNAPAAPRTVRRLGSEKLSIARLLYSVVLGQALRFSPSRERRVTIRAPEAAERWSRPALISPRPRDSLG